MFSLLFSLFISTYFSSNVLTVLSCSLFLFTLYLLSLISSQLPYLFLSLRFYTLTFPFLIPFFPTSLPFPFFFLSLLLPYFSLSYSFRSYFLTFPFLIPFIPTSLPLHFLFLSFLLPFLSISSSFRSYFLTFPFLIPFSFSFPFPILLPSTFIHFIFLFQFCPSLLPTFLLIPFHCHFFSPASSTKAFDPCTLDLFATFLLF